MLQSHQPSVVHVKWLDVAYEMATFFRFSKVLKKHFDEDG